MSLLQSFQDRLNKSKSIFSSFVGNLGKPKVSSPLSSPKQFDVSPDLSLGDRLKLSPLGNVLPSLQRTLEDPSKQLFPKFSPQTLKDLPAPLAASAVAANILSGAANLMTGDAARVGLDIARGKDIASGKEKAVSPQVRFGMRLADPVARLGGRDVPSRGGAFDTLGFYGAGTQTIPFTNIRAPEFGISESNVVKDIGLGLRAFAPPLAAHGAFNNTKALLAYPIVGGLFNTAIGDRSQGGAWDRFVVGADATSSKAATMAGIASFTNPVIEALNLGKATIPLKTIANVGEGVIMDKATGLETTIDSMLIDAIVPLGIEVGTGALKQVNVRTQNRQIRQAIDNGIFTEGPNNTYILNERFASRDQVLKHLDMVKAEYNANKQIKAEAKKRMTIEDAEQEIVKLENKIKKGEELEHKEVLSLLNLDKFVAALKALLDDERGFIRIGKSDDVIKSGDEIGKIEVGPKGVKKERGSIETIRGSDAVSKQAKEALEKSPAKDYITKPNKRTQKKAVNSIVEDYIGELEKAKSSKINTPEGTAKALILADDAVKRGDYEAEVDILENYVRSGTVTAQTMQARTMLNRMSPEGMLVHAIREADKANANKGWIDRILGRPDAKITPETARKVTDLMAEANKLPLNERWPVVKKAMELINKDIPISGSEYFDAYRYENMLSNPKTQLKNTVTNMGQMFLTRPLTMAFEVPYDWGRSVLTGAERQRYLSDVPQYYRDVYNSMPLGVDAFMRAMRGEVEIEKPDLKYLRRVSGPFSRLMEGADRFNQVIVGSATKADLMNKGMSEMKAKKEADKIAANLFFRTQADPKNKTGQGVLLSKIDALSSTVSNVPGRKWLVPFIQTPTNVAKQWVEFSPAGIATLPGNANKVSQLSKTTLGSIATLIGAKLAAEGNITWGVPEGMSPEDKAVWYEVNKPYSVKVGEKNIPLMYFGPFAMALGLPGAYEYHDKVSKDALTSSKAEVALKTVQSQLALLSDQTFLAGFNNMLQLLSGDLEVSKPDALKSSLGFTATQVVPWAGFQRYISTILDPTIRKNRRFMDSFNLTIPGRSERVFPYLDPEGNPVQRDPVNLVLPFDISTIDREYEPILEGIQQDAQTSVFRNYQNRVKAIQRDRSKSEAQKEFELKELDEKLERAIEKSGNLNPVMGPSSGFGRVGGFGGSSSSRSSSLGGF